MPQASIVIVTRNRREMAKRCVESALAQEGDVEVIVLDDASTDGTAEFIREHCPRAVVDRVEKQTGYVVQRSRAAELATSPVIVSIDDDAYFLDPRATLKTLALMDDPRVGAVAIPFLNQQRKGPDVCMLQPAPDDAKLHLVYTFIGTAYAVRRDVFQRLGGFNNYLFHWGEEVEFCQRLFAGGYVVRLGTEVLIRHCPGWDGKYTPKVERYLYRNRVLTAWLNAPWPYLPAWVVGTTLWAIKRFLLESPHRLSALSGTGMGYLAMLGAWRSRRPIKLKTYRRWLYLRKHPGLTPEEFDPDNTILRPARQ